MENSMTISGLMASNTGLNLDNPDTGVRVAPEIASRIRATGARTSGVYASCTCVSPERMSDACTSPASCADDIILLSIEKEKEIESREESAKQNFFRKVSYSDARYLHFVRKVSHKFLRYLPSPQKVLSNFAEYLLTSRKVLNEIVRYLPRAKKVSHEFGWYLLNLIIARFYV